MRVVRGTLNPWGEQPISNVTVTKRGEGMDPLESTPWALAKARYELLLAERSGSLDDRAKAQSLVNQLVAEWYANGGN